MERLRREDQLVVLDDRVGSSTVDALALVEEKWCGEEVWKRGVVGCLPVLEEGLGFEGRSGRCRSVL